MMQILVMNNCQSRQEMSMRSFVSALVFCGIALLCKMAMAQNIPPDIVVAADGSGNFKTVQEAVQSVPKANRERIVILIRDGVYREKVRIDAAYVTLRGQSRRGTRIEYSQLNEDFTKNPDEIGRAVVNINGSDTVLENLTIANTAGIVGPHSFAIYGKADRTVIVDCDVLSEGADTVSLWRGQDGRYYHARCNFRGAVDFVCPRGWCYIRDSTFFETKNTAAMWHDGSKDRDQKFVMRNCKFDGVEGWQLARHHHDAQFYWLDCTFSKTMTDRAPYRVIYPLGGATPTEADIKRNEELDKTNLWGERAYFYNCHREGGDYVWHKDNLATALGSPRPEQITAAWTFAGKWDPESTTGPKIERRGQRDSHFVVAFTENVTVKGRPRLVLSDGTFAYYATGSGTGALTFNIPTGSRGLIQSVDLNGGAIIASAASATTLAADLALPMQSAASAAAPHDFARWEPEIAAYEKMDRTNPPPHGAVLFVGSSTIRLWNTLAQDFPKHRVINRGFGGSEIVDSTNFAERIIFPHKPRMIFLRAGGNDIHNGKSPEQVFADFKGFVAKVHSKLPTTDIVFISLAPAIARWDEAEKNKALNTLVKEYVRRTPHVQYIETYDTTLGANGKPRPELFVEDKLHFSAEGYKLLTERVRPFLPK
jgi:pectinesterase